MLNFCSLQSLYLTQIEASSPHFHQAISQFLEFQTVPSLDIVEEYDRYEPFLSEDQALKKWKQLLTVNLLCHLTQSYSSEIATKVRLFERHPWNQSSQYFRSLVALNHALAKMPIPEAGPHLLESGAALIDLYEYCPWLSLPYTPHHFEFGIFLSLLALLTKREDLQEIVLRIANWQLNTLDIEAKPLPGLFVREHEGRNFQHLCLSYLLFRSAAIFSESAPFAAIAVETMKRIQERLEKNQEKVDPLWVLLEKCLEPYTVASSGSLDLSEHIYDPSTALVGYRTATQHLICTLHGGHTGLGDFRQKDIEVVNYGPQYLPLGECQGFGIEGNALSDHGMRRSMIEWRRGAFILKGCTRLIDQPVSSSLEAAKFRGIWLEVAQEFKKPHFYLKTTFMGLDGWEGIAFSFFVKAASCKVQSQVLYPRTLESYKGETETILFEGQENYLELRPLSFSGTMHVTPLAGGDHFWGADFLVAYLLSPNHRHYQWHLGPPL